VKESGMHNIRIVLPNIEDELVVDVVPQLDGLHDELGASNLLKFTAGSVGPGPTVEGCRQRSHEHQEEGPDHEEPGNAAQGVTDERQAAGHGRGHWGCVEVLVTNGVLDRFIRGKVFFWG